MEPINLRPAMNMILYLKKVLVLDADTMKPELVTPRRAKAILNMLSQIQLVSKFQSQFRLTASGLKICDWIKENNWTSVEEYLSKHHAAYNRLEYIIKEWDEIGNKAGIPKKEVVPFEKELLDRRRVPEAMIRNNVVLGFLLDWGERLRAITENKLSKPPRLYIPDRKLPQKQYKLLKATYSELAGKGLGEKYYLPIPLLREYSCEFLRIQRRMFDHMLANLHKNKSNYVTLIGAPETTIALEGARSIKRIKYTSNNVLEVDRSSLYGLKVNTGTYYYVHLEVDKV